MKFLTFALGASFAMVSLGQKDLIQSRLQKAFKQFKEDFEGTFGPQVQKVQEVFEEIVEGKQKKKPSHHKDQEKLPPLPLNMPTFQINSEGKVIQSQPIQQTQEKPKHQESQHLLGQYPENKHRPAEDQKQELLGAHEMTERYGKKGKRIEKMQKKIHKLENKMENLEEKLQNSDVNSEKREKMEKKMQRVKNRMERIKSRKEKRQRMIENEEEIQEVDHKNLRIAERKKKIMQRFSLKPVQESVSEEKKSDQ